MLYASKATNLSNIEISTRMQFNSILFPGPGMSIKVNYQNIIYIPRNRLPAPVEKKLIEANGDGSSSSSMSRSVIVRDPPNKSGGLLSCFSASNTRSATNNS